MSPEKIKGYRHLPAFLLLALAHGPGHGAAASRHHSRSLAGNGRRQNETASARNMRPNASSNEKRRPEASLPDAVNLWPPRRPI